MTDGFFSTQSRLRHLDQLWLPCVLIAALIAYGIYGSLHSTLNYGDPEFVVALFSSEIMVAVYLLLITALFFPVDRIGLRRPDTIEWKKLWPLLVLLGIVFSSWLFLRVTAPTVDNTLSLGILRTTLLVGLNEEWIFRGLLMAAFCRRFGLRNGALISLLLFGLAHAGNALISEYPLLSLLQVLTSMMTGSLLLLAALATRSLLPVMLAHGLYDFMVLDISVMAKAGANPVLLLPMMAANVLLGSYGLYCVFKLKGGEPFPSQKNLDAHY